MSTIVTNPKTGVQYNSVTGNSVHRYMVAKNGIVEGSPVLWPFNNGEPHDIPDDYYEYVPFEPVAYDADIYAIDERLSCWHVVPKVPAAAAGYPQGVYKITEVTRRLTVAELTKKAEAYCISANNTLWPQEQGYGEKVVFVKELTKNQAPTVEQAELISNYNKTIEAMLKNDSNLRKIKDQINAAGENGAINFKLNQGWILAV